MAVISFKCPNCDGELIFDPETQKYKCEYCGSKFTQAELDALQPAESEETDAGAADGSDEAEQETTEQQSADTKKKEGEDSEAYRAVSASYDISSKEYLKPLLQYLKEN